MLSDLKEKLKALPDDKRQKILAASIAEFAEHGYENASTNRIVVAAGISKGLLFHYFGSKKRLFLFVLGHIINILMAKMNTYSAGLTGDLFATMGEIALIKTRISIEEPEMYRILFDVFLNLPRDIKKELTQIYGGILSDQRKAFTLKIDPAKLRDGITPEIAANLIADFLDGYYQRNLELFKKYTPEEFIRMFSDIREDLMRYMEIIRRAVYKD